MKTKQNQTMSTSKYVHPELTTLKGAVMATRVGARIEAKELMAFGRGRQSLEHSVWYSGHLMTFLATGEDTQGQFALIEAVARKGNVPPPHIHHREDEIFYVLEGEMTVSVGDRTIKAKPGTMVFLPRDVVHSFTIDSDQARILVLATPAGLEGYFQECSVPAPAMMLPPAVETPYGEIQKMLPVARKFGIEFVLAKS
jgi:quercetin dioxygenase-like cupin family protein